MKLLQIEAYKTSQILLVLVVIILIFPVLLTLPAIGKIFNFSTTGQIGDTIGGITAPFINGLAAILVFIAFKAQIKANELLKHQEESRNILDQISSIQDARMEKLLVEELCTYLEKRGSKIIFLPHSFHLTDMQANDYAFMKQFLKP